MQTVKKQVPITCHLRVHLMNDEHLVGCLQVQISLLK